MGKFLESKLLDNYEVLTDDGWVDILAIHKTIPYKIYRVHTKDYNLECADDHIVFNEKLEEVFVKNLIIGNPIMTEDGLQEILDIQNLEDKENMFDLEIDSDNKRYYTNGILSHNTTYLKYLTSLIKKDVLFIPPSMAEMLSEPSIIPFLMNNQNTVLIIEDAERVISNRDGVSSSPAGVSNLLNITDGILGDCLGIQVIATFNTDKENIDKALLRKGRLIAEHNFTGLSVDATNELLKQLGKNVVSNKGLVLSDIYNIEDDQIRSSNNKQIGFL